MCQHQKKHNIIGILLVLALLILTSMSVFPSPVFAQDEVWDCPGFPRNLDVISAPQYCSGDIDPPLSEVKKLVLQVEKVDVPISLGLLADLGQFHFVSIIWDGASWQSGSTPEYVISVTTGDFYDIIEVTFTPPLPEVEQVCLTLGASLWVQVFVWQLQLVYSPLQNQPPVADANGPYTGIVGVPVTLDGSGSSDPDGDIILYEWDFNGDGTYDYSHPTDPITTYAYPEAIVCNAVLRVTDAAGQTDTDSATVTISEIALALLPPFATNPVGTQHTVTASYQIAADPIPLLELVFEVISGPNTKPFGGVGPLGAKGEVSFTYPSSGGPGTDTIRATVIDRAGAPLASAEAIKTWTEEGPSPVEVGGNVYPADKLAVLAPWILLAAALSVGVIIALKRRRA
jgi:hypothetical protein